jgi:DNA-binding Lrp family transcriptional regulator
MVLTERDKKLLSIIQSYGILKTKEIAIKVFPGVRLTTVLRRLRRLEDAGYIQKIMGLESAERLWSVTDKTMQKVLSGAAKIHFPRAILEHDSYLSSLRLRLESAGIAKAWIPEHDIRKQVATKYGLKGAARKVIPDGILSLEVNGLRESVAVELELSAKNQSRYREILYDYSGKENLWAVWYLVQSSTVERQILKARKALYRGSSGPKILFSKLDDVMLDPLNAVISDGTSKSHLCDLLVPKCKSTHAHTPAQVVSRQDQEKVL